MTCTCPCWVCPDPAVLEARGPGVPEDKWGGGTGVPQGGSCLACGLNAWMKQPLPEAISAAQLSPKMLASRSSPLSGSPVLGGSYCPRWHWGHQGAQTFRDMQS